MSKRNRLLLAASLSVLLLLALPLVYFVWMITSQSRARAEWEHGMVLPASAGKFQCRGDANHLFLDRGASTVFEMPATDLAAFKSGLKINPARQTHVPGNAQYNGFAFPWTAAAPLETLHCDSPKGDWLHLEIWPLASGRVGVWMYTDWN